MVDDGVSRDCPDEAVPSPDSLMSSRHLFASQPSAGTDIAIVAVVVFTLSLITGFMLGYKARLLRRSCGRESELVNLVSVMDAESNTVSTLNTPLANSATNVEHIPRHSHMPRVTILENAPVVYNYTASPSTDSRFQQQCAYEQQQSMITSGIYQELTTPSSVKQVYL